jgi:excisionase family DNA binding protein
MPDDDFLLLDEVMRLARAESISTVRHWLRTGKLASVRPGRRRMVRRSDLEAFLRRGSLPGPTPPAPTDPRQLALPSTKGAPGGGRDHGE